MGPLKEIGLNKTRLNWMSSSPCACAIDRLSRERQKHTRAPANQSAHIPPVPIRTPHSSCANQDALAVVTPKRQKTNSDTSARHAYTRTLHVTSRPRLYFFQYNVSSPLLCFWPSRHSLFGIKNESLQMHHNMFPQIYR